MYVIEVIPLIRGTALSSLSYFSAKNYPLGSILQVPIRQKNKPAIVIKTSAVEEAKSQIRQAAFTLQKLPAQDNISSVPENLLKTAEALSRHYPAAVGAILYQLLPVEVRSGDYLFPKISSTTHQEDTIPQVLTMNTAERFVAYRSHIRSVLAHRGSVIFVAPSSAALYKAREMLSIGIEDRVVFLAPSEAKSSRLTELLKFEDTSTAKLILTTPSYAYLDRVDLISLIIDEEGSDYYRSQVRPYLDHRDSLIIHASTTGRSIILGDLLPRSETENARREDRFSTYDRETKRLALPAPLTIIKQNDKPTSDEPFKLFSKALDKAISTTLARPGRVFLFGARRGLAPVVACIDCGHIFRCPDSGTPYSLLRTKDKSGGELRWFISRTSGKRIRAADTCEACGSWRLRERGIGIQAVFDECQLHFPKTKILLFDQETASSNRKASALMKQFYNERSIIMVGTEIALSYLNLESVDLSAVVSCDALRSSQTWRADEKSLRLLLKLREYTSKEVLVQSRSDEDDLLKYAKTGTVDQFYTEELELRSNLNYPPYSVFVLLTWRGEIKTVNEIESIIKTSLEKFKPNFYSDPLSKPTLTLRHALIRLSLDPKDRQECFSILKALSPAIKIEINPPRIV